MLFQFLYPEVFTQNNYRLTDIYDYIQEPPDWQEILASYRGSELQNYFTRILEDDLNAIIKPQYVDNIPKAVRYCILLSIDFLVDLNILTNLQENTPVKILLFPIDIA